MKNASHVTRPMAVGAFLIGLLLTALAVVWHARSNAAHMDERFAAAAIKVTAGIGTSLQRYEFGLRGARGAVIAAGPGWIDPERYRQYAGTRDLPREFPGVHGIGVIRRVPAADLPRYVQAHRRQGRPDFAIRQLTPSDGERFIIELVEPLDRNRAAIGLDVASEATRRTAAVASMRSGMATLTGPITLVQASSKPQRSFLLMLPIYRPGADIGSVAAREAAAEGWAYAPLIIDEVLSGIDLRDGQIDLSLRDVTDEPATAPFFSTRSAEAEAVAPRVETLEVFGRRWVAELRPTAQFEKSLGLIDPRWTTLLGAIVSTLLASWAASVDRSRRIEAQRRLSEAHRAAMVTASEDAIVGLSLEGRITSWNPAAQRLFGLTADEALGQSLDLLLPPDQQADPQGHVLPRVAAGEVVAPFESVRRRRDGQLLEVSISAVPLLDGGHIVGVAKTYRDVSARKAAERQLLQSYAELEARLVERTALVEASRRDLRRVLDALPPLVGAWTLQLKNRFANAAYASYFGKSPEEIAHMTLPELLGPELFARNEPFVRRALAGEEVQFERDLPMANGQGVRHTLAHYLPYHEDGEVAGFFVLVHDVTELKLSQRRASAATRKADALLDMVQQHAIFSITDQAGRILDVNEAFCEITGYARDELIGHTHNVVLSKAQGDGFWAEVFDTVRSGASWHGEICNLAKDGSTHWVDSIITPFVGETGKIENYISVCFDITQRKAAEAALAARERIMRLVFDAYPGVLAYWDRDMRCVFANRAYDDWLGVQPAEMIGRTQRELLDEETFARNEPLMQAALRGEARTVERHRVTASGRAVDYLLHYVPDGVGADVQGFISATVDITERKRAEEEANRISAQLRAVLDAATEVSIIAVDPDGAIALFNSGAERLLGYRREDVMGQESLTSFHDLEELRLQARALSEHTGRKVRTDHVLFDDDALGVAQTWSYRRKDGSSVKVSLTVTAMLDAEGRSIGHLAVAHDVSRQKEYERSLQAAAEAAQRANLAKSQFLANMSHEIRTPLNALIGVGHLLAGTPLDADQRHLLAKSQLAGRSLMGIVNDVLDLAKIEAGELTLEHAPFEPREILAEVDAMFRTKTEEKGLVYELRCDDAVPDQLVGDAVRVRQILVNLVGNAVKFTAQGSIRVHLQLLNLGATVARLRCSVGDTGAGVAKEAQPRLFQAFSQADASTTRRYGGTGLGLSIVRQLAQTMGGEVGLRSELGQGSEFWAVLSLALPDTEVLTEATRASALLDVWIVGAPNHDRHALVALARSLGWRATELETDTALLAQIDARLAAAAALPDALIVSERLSGASADRITDILQQRLGPTQMPALLSFDDRDPAQAAATPSDGRADRQLHKPVGTSELFNAVNDAVAARTGSSAKVLLSTRVGSLDARWLAGVRVLVVDDSEVNREVAQRLLAREGADVQTCHDGQEALAALRAQPKGYDVVLMDVQMAGMDGLEATRRLCGELGLTLPVVALTAGALVEERRRALDAGMTDFLTKPLDPQTLVRTLRRVVEAQSGSPLLIGRSAGKPNVDAPWPAVAGIDAAEAALRTAGDPLLWQSLLASLMREFSDLAAPTMTVPAAPEDRLALAARLHKLRGGSGTVGAREVHRLATHAEAALATPGAHAAAAIAELAQALRLLFDAATPVLAQHAQALRQAATQVDAHAAPLSREEQEDLLEHLRQQSMSAIDAFEALAPRLGRAHGGELVLQVRQSLDALDFTRALDLLEAAH